MEDPEDIIRNIPASVLSDIERLDEAIAMVSEMENNDFISEQIAEQIMDALGDTRSALLYLAEKHDKLVVQLQELKP